MPNPTHTLVKTPRIDVRFLADYMAAGSRERRRRSIIRDCKFRAIARVVQHKEAKVTVANSLTTGNPDPVVLLAKAASIKARLTADPFEAELNRHNGDYIERFAGRVAELVLPKAEIVAPGKLEPLPLAGVRVSLDLAVGLRRLTKTNKLKLGGVMLRYEKGKPLPPETGLWQSAFLAGYLRLVAAADDVEPELALCITLDVWSGACVAAPGDSVSRFKEIEAACASIAERWPNVPPPPGAVLA